MATSTNNTTAKSGTTAAKRGTTAPSQEHHDPQRFTRRRVPFDGS